MAEAANGVYRRWIRLMNGAVMKENLVISESKSGEKISKEAIREAPSRILESAMFIQSDIARGVILSNDGIFEPGPLERCESLEPEIANPTLKIRCAERSSLLASAPIGSSEVRE
jgi:hypothetical protein